MIGSILRNYEIILDKIVRTAQAVGRQPDSVKLLVVTKGHALETVRAAIYAGARALGENYAEEGAEKVAALKATPNLEWHMIGHVQSRKARLVCENFAWVHSVDSLKLAERLDRFAGELGRRMPVLLECNVSGEETKFGFPAWQEAGWEALTVEFDPILGLPNLEVCGLMTMAPYGTDSEAARPYFQKLRCLRDLLGKQYPNVSELSMGMSADFETAIQEGATIVRIGEAILGPRQVRGA